MTPIPAPARVAPWVIWSIILAAVTWVLVAVRGDLDQAHVVLTFLLVVVGGSVAGGRGLGMLLACAGFLLIDYYFQQPFDVLTVGKRLDLVVLVAFLATAAVTTQLLALARAEAEAARRRADEIASLSRLGSESLNAPRAEDALGAIARVVRATLGVVACEIFEWIADDERLVSVAQSGAPAGDRRLRMAAIEAAARGGSVVIIRPGGTTERIALDSDDIESAQMITRVDALAVPLRVHAHTVGVLCVDWVEPTDLGLSERRFLTVLCYYAALGVDRALLAAEAEHVEALREADRLKDMVLASVSHDLRTPLTTIKALAQHLALEGNATAAIIEEQADRLARFVGDILDLSRMKSGHFPVETELNTADDVIGAVVRHTAGLTGAVRLETSVDLSQPALLGRFDFVQTLRVLTNLIENAVRFSPPGGRVELGVTRRGDELLFDVADRGPGVSPSDQTLIFEPFFRPVGSHPDAGRAGLGLSIARALALAQHGSLEYSPRPGGGSVFTLRLPGAEIHDVPANAQ